MSHDLSFCNPWLFHCTDLSWPCPFRILLGKLYFTAALPLSPASDPIYCHFSQRKLGLGERGGARKYKPIKVNVFSSLLLPSDNRKGSYTNLQCPFYFFSNPTNTRCLSSQMLWKIYWKDRSHSHSIFSFQQMSGGRGWPKNSTLDIIIRNLFQLPFQQLVIWLIISFKRENS